MRYEACIFIIDSRSGGRTILLSLDELNTLGYLETAYGSLSPAWSINLVISLICWGEMTVSYRLDAADAGKRPGNVRADDARGEVDDDAGAGGADAAEQGV